MALIFVGRAAFGAIAAILVAGPVLAESRPADGSGYARAPHRHLSAQALPPETRYRDPRYLPPPRRRAPGFGQPDFLIQAYLPRNTNLPMYNEPPSRFPQR